ncbi:MAG: tol-pal system protein YbgF [Alphaproteobacteria bacterium]
MVEATEGWVRQKLLALGCAAIFSIGLTIGLALPAASQQTNLQSLLNRLERMQRELSTLQSDFYRGNPPSGRAGPRSAFTGNSADAAIVARMQVRLDEFETELRNFTGKIEEMNHNINQLTANVKKLVSDLEFRLGALEQSRQVAGALPAGTAAPSGAPVTKSAIGGGAEIPAGSAKQGVLGMLTATEAGAPAGKKAGKNKAKAAKPSTQTAKALPKPLPPGTPEEQYKFARSLLIQSDFSNAERSLRAFVDAYPKHDLAGNAKYWLGETYYVRNDFGNAARTFAEGYQTYPISPKAPDNLLKLGLSLIHLGNKRDACATFSRLAKEFPKAPSNILRRTKQERKRNDCRR